MRAIILAAGVGRRLGDSVTERPKSLVEIGDRSLLDRSLDALETVGVQDIVVVVGYLADQIRDRVGSRAAVRTVYNPDYRKGAVVSLWTAREYLDTDVLVMDADVLYPVSMLSLLVRSPHANCFLMDGRAANDGEAMMLMACGGRVWDITRGLRGDYDAAGESVGFLKLSAPAAATLRELLEDAVASGRDRIEHEELYPDLMRRHALGYERVDDFPWTEVDFPEDVARARAMVTDGLV